MDDIPDKYKHLPTRQRRAIEIAIEDQQVPEGEPFQQDTIQATKAVALLSRIAKTDSPFALEAATILKDWRAMLATPEQIAAVDANDDLEVGCGADTSAAPEENGYWIHTWTWTRI